MDRTWRIHVVSEMTGVPEGLIRAWERRYGVPRPSRTESGYRAYSARDVEVLRRLKKLTDEGVAIAEAVRLLPSLEKEAKAALARRGDVEIRAPGPAQLTRWHEELLLATQRSDQPALERLLDEALASLPPLAFHEDVALPFLVEVGARWERGSLSVAEEHLATQAVRARVVGLLEAAPKRARRHALCACFPDEEHDLGLFGVALRLRHAGWRVTWLGGRVPVDQLARTLAAVKPDLVALSAVRDDGASAFAAVLDELKRLVPAGAGAPRFLFGGRAAEAHQDLVVAAGHRLVLDDDAWDEALDVSGR